MSVILLCKGCGIRLGHAGGPTPKTCPNCRTEHPWQRAPRPVPAPAVLTFTAEDRQFLRTIRVDADG